MITEDYVSFETAKLLKEKGFSEECHYAYHYYTHRPFYHRKMNDFNGGEYQGLKYEWYSAPTLQMAMKWLRDKHDIFIEISVDEMPKDNGYQWALYHNSTKEIMPYADWEKTYEEACEAAIKYCLEKLI